MNYRTVKIHASENLGVTGTKVIPLNVKDPITALLFPCSIYTDAALRLAPEASAFTKIEIVDGSDVLLELSGTEMAALAFYEGQKVFDGLAGDRYDVTIPFRLRIPFGRYFLDPELALDPKQFRNPQLKITFNTHLVEATAKDLYFSCLAECFDEKVISPMGFLRMTQLHSYTGAATAYEYINLPTDLLIRKLYLQTKNFSGGPAGNLTDVKLSEDNDKRIPFELDDTEWSLKDAAEFGRCSQIVYTLCGGWAVNPFFAIPGDNEQLLVGNIAATRAIMRQRQIGCGYSCISDTTADIAAGEVSGTLPFQVYCYPFGNQMDMADWYDVTKVGSLVWRVQSGATGASCTYNTILQQLRRY